MNKPNFIFKVFLFLFAFSVTSAFAQTENKSPAAEPTYEIVLQLLTASNNVADKNAVAPALTAVVKRLKTLYAFSAYRLTTTYLQRTSNSVEYKSLMNDFSSNAEKTAPAFSDWSLRNLRTLPDSQGRKTIQFDNFRFGARIPIMVQTFGDGNGKSAPVLNYESIGINNSRFSLPENEPTVLGSLATSKADELMFLVLTVRAVE